MTVVINTKRFTVEDALQLYMQYSMKKDYTGAIKHFSKLINKYPKNYEYLFQMGNVHINLGSKPKKAIVFYDLCIKKSTTHTSARYNRILCYISIKQYSLAISELTKLLKIDGSNISLIQKKAECYQGIKDYKKASVEFQKCSNLLNEKVYKLELKDIYEKESALNLENKQ